MSRGAMDGAYDPWGGRCPRGAKRRYSTRKAALGAMNLERARQARGERLTAPNGVYRCRLCGDWHLTSNATKPRAVSR